MKRTVAVAFLLMFCASHVLAQPAKPDVGVQSENDREQAYVAKLHQKYGDRLTFASDHAAEIVTAFNIDCHARDHRYLPLINVLYSQMAALDTTNSWLTIDVDNRDDDVRVYGSVRSKGGPVSRPQVLFELNKWGELRAIGITTDALMYVCSGAYGPLWKTE